MSAMAILRATCKLVVLHSDEPTVLQDECNNLSVIMGIMLPFRNCAFPALQWYPPFQWLLRGDNSGVFSKYTAIIYNQFLAMSQVFMLMKRLNELPYFTIVAMDLLGLSSFKGLFTVCFFFWEITH